MSLMNVYQISSQGMSAQRERLEAAATNLANANTTRTAAGGPYRRRDVILESVSSASALDAPFGTEMGMSAREPDGVQSRTLVSESAEGIKRHLPGHPDADANGYVTMPDVDSLEETVNLMSAARAFEANVTAFNTAKELARASLKLGEA
ncbi:MAG: flagellar basal body rod protein FlgC [Pyrinomonadaceae bacterium]